MTLQKLGLVLARELLDELLRVGLRFCLQRYNGLVHWFIGQLGHAAGERGLHLHLLAQIDDHGNVIRRGRLPLHTRLIALMPLSEDLFGFLDDGVALVEHRFDVDDVSKLH